MRDARSGMNYRDLEIWKLAREAAVSVHRMTPCELPKFEVYEEASQIRRSVKSIRANIVEGMDAAATNRTSFASLFLLTRPVTKRLITSKAFSKPDR